jgi:hypothetical protein
VLRLALALALALVAPGCLGGVDPAHLPESALAGSGWVLLGEQTQSHAGGLAEQVLLEYGQQNDRPLDGIIVGTVTNVPFYDERKLVPEALARAERDLGVDLEETGKRTVQLSTLGTSVEGTLYDMRRGPATGKALLFEVPPCDDFAVVLAFGPESSDGLLFGSNENRFEEAVQMGRTVDC